MLHASLSLSHSASFFTFYLEHSPALCTGCTPERTQKFSPIFSLLPFTIVHTPVGCTSAVTPDPRLEAGCIVTRVSLVSHVALSGHVSRDIASQLIPISPPSLEIAVVWPPVSGQKPNVKKQVPECKSHPWPAWLWVLITQSPPGCWPEPPLAEPGHTGLWLVTADPSLVTAFLACAVARGSQGLTSRKYFTKYYTIQYTGAVTRSGPLTFEM